MNITANNVASKLFVAFVAAAMLFTLATPAKAATATELQAQIDALMAQIAALQGSTPAATTPATTACTFTKALTVGSQGADVKCLQDYLTPKYFTNAGGSTGYFGSVTAAAVAAWQTANGVMPAAGYFGPVSQAKYAALMAATPTTPGTDDSDDDDTATPGDLSGEASLNNVQIDSASDDELDEGSEDAEVATVTFEFEDGDAMITRLDVAFDGVNDDVWDVLDEVSLWVDGDEVARMSASDEDDYQDEDTGTLRFSGLDLVAMEDEELEVMIAATINNSVDSGDQGSYNVSVDSFRWVDGDDVTETETTGNDLDTDVTFTLGEAGQDDELIVKTSSEDPDGTTLQVETDAKSDWYTIFAFDLDTDDSENEVQINELSLIVDTASSTGSAGDLSFANLVDDVEIVIDGVTVDDLVVSGGTATGTAVGFDESRVLRFDVDGDVTIDAGDRVTVELRARFNSLASANEGATVRARVSAANSEAIDAEGTDNLTALQLSGAAEGDTHTLRTAGVNVTAGDMSADVTVVDAAGVNDYGTFEIEIEVTAFEQDVYISTTPGTAMGYVLEDSTGSTSVAGSRSAVLTSTGDEVGSAFEITEGSTETLTLTVTYTPGVANTASRLNLNTLNFGSTSGAPTGQSWTASPDEDYRTAVKTMVN